MTTALVSNEGPHLPDRLLPTHPLAAGADAADLAALVHVALSRVIGELSGERRLVRELCRALGVIAHLDFRRLDGTIEPAPDPTAPTSFPASETILSNLGRDRKRLDDEWRLVRTRDRVHATLPVDLVAAFFPPSLALMAARFVLWGPGEANDRLELALALEAGRTVTTGPRKGETVSIGSVELMQTAVRKLMRVLVELREAGYPSALLDQWKAVPARINVIQLGAVPANLDRSAPPRILVRHALRLLDADVQRRTQTETLRKTLFLPLRDRAIVGVIADHGTRAGAVVAQRVADYDPNHEFPDGEIGPALRIYPGKTISRAVGRWKAVPDELATWIQEYLDYAEIGGLPEHPLWYAKKGQGKRRRPSEGPQPITPQRIGKMVAARLRAAGADRGYSPHTLRHLADQLAQASGADYLESNPDSLRHVSPQVFGDALLDHTMASDKLGYLDLQDERGRERWARKAALGVWEYLRGDRGARKGQDKDRIERARNQRAECLAQLAAVEASVESLRNQRRSLRSRMLAPTASPSAEEMLRAILRLSDFDDSLDAELEERDHVIARLHASDAELTASVQARIPLPDDASGEEVVEVVEESALSAGADPEPIRDWLTITEAAFAFGVSEPTMRRWFRGFLPHPEGDPRNPWQPSDVGAVVEVRSSRKRRLIVANLDRSRIAPDVMAAIKEMLCSPPQR